jgi:hypothetical protein
MKEEEERVKENCLIKKRERKERPSEVAGPKDLEKELFSELGSFKYFGVGIGSFIFYVIDQSIRY